MRAFPILVICLACISLPIAQAEEPMPAGPLQEGKPASHWMSELKKDDVFARRKAVYALFKLGPSAKTAATQLARAFEDEDDYVRDTAYKALIALKEDAKPAVKALRSALNDGRSRVRQLAVWALLRIDPATAFRDEDFDVRKAAVSVVMDPSDFLDEAVFAELIARTGDEEEEIRARAATAIANAYIFHGRRRPYITRAKARLAGIFRRMAAEDEESIAREWSVYALESIACYPRGPKLAEAIFPVLLAATRDTSPGVRGKAFGSLQSVGRTDAGAEAACRMGLKDPEARVRAAACAGIASMSEGSPATVSALIIALDDSHRWVRGGAAGALGGFETKSASAVPALTARFLMEKRLAVQQALAQALGDIGPAALPALPHLIAAFKASEEPSAPLAYALVRLDAPNRAAALNRLVDVALSPVGGGAQALLGRLGTKAAPVSPTLIEVLTKGEPAERIQAAYTLSYLGPAATFAVPILEKLVQSGAAAEKALAKAARFALERIRKP